MSPPSRALVCAASAPPLAEARRALEGDGHAVTAQLLGEARPEAVAGHRLLVVDGAGEPGGALDLCRRLRPAREEAFVPLLYVADGAADRLGAYDAGADACLARPFAPAELTAQARALARIKQAHDALADRAAEFHRVNNRLQQAYKQIDQELELAQRLQASFLPQSLPQVPHVRFAVHYLLCGRVGGDFYDIFRLDERHVGFYVADAMGHGVPASLLTIFVKKGVRAKEVFGQQYRLVPPDEVLGRLNHDLIDQRLSEHPFITMAYGLFDHVDGTVQFARAGHPYPVFIPRDGEPALWTQDGLLLGIAETRFPCTTHRLGPGDKLLLYTDGVDYARYGEHGAGVESLLACVREHRALPAQELVARLSRDLFGPGPQPDDLTLLAVERSG